MINFTDTVYARYNWLDNGNSEITVAYITLCAIYYHLENVKNIHGGVIVLVKLQAKPATLPKVSFLYGCFSRFLNCTNGTKSRKTLHTRLHLFQIGTHFSAFCNAPNAPCDYEIFKSSVDIFQKKRQNPTDPNYVTTASRVGSLISCK